MSLAAGEIDVDADETLRRAKVAKLIMESAVLAVTVLIYARLLLREDTTAAFKRRVRRWRTALFGPPPLTEEQIQDLSRQVMIEAIRTVRYGK